MAEKTPGQLAHDAWHNGPNGDRPSLWDKRAPEYQIAWDFSARAVRAHVLEEAAQIAHRLTDDETRRALGANAVIVASQIENAIRALAKDGAE